MKLQSLLLLAGTAVLLASPVLADTHPDISGTWMIDAAKSDFGPQPPADDMQLKIRVEGADFFVNQSGGGQGDVDLHFSTDGKEIVNELPGAKLKGAYHWDQKVLVGELKVETDDGNTITFKDRISYSGDNKVMTLDRDMSGPMGDAKVKLVLNRK
jgi:hypothetical protein